MTKGCIACHGPTMAGNQIMGAPNLVDSVYRFTEEDQHASYVKTITNGVNQHALNPNSRSAEMPAFGDSEVISKDQIKKLTVFVHQLGGGK